MPSIRITRFGGMNLEVNPRLAMPYVAQKAHNCLLWDGALRPLAKWIKLPIITDIDSRSIDLAPDGVSIEVSSLIDAAFLKGATYPSETKIGISQQPTGVVDSTIFYQNRHTPPNGSPVDLHPPFVTSGVVDFIRQFKSDKPVNRMYGVTGIRRRGNTVEESVLVVIPNQSTQSIVYEGDIAVISVDTTPLNAVPYDGLRLYRTVSGMDTGASPQNELDTDWYLIAETNTTHINYSDGGSATNDPLDLYLAKNFYPPPTLAFSFLSLLEGGWVAAATTSGTVVLSERYILHAYPTENLWQIPGEQITDMVGHYDNLYVGTRNKPYNIAIAVGEKLAVQGSVTPFPEAYECLPGTMDRTPAGAMYASPSGLVALSKEGMRLLTAGFGRGVDAFYKIKNTYSANGDPLKQLKEVVPVRFQDTKYGAYYHGTYFGFCGVRTKEDEQKLLQVGYMVDTSSTLDGERPLSKLVTMEVPFGVSAHTTGGSGLYVLGVDGVYLMPFPDAKGAEVYKRAEKYCYKWKSRKQVFPGQMTMAAGKIVHDCGCVKLKIYVDCECVYETVITDCKPFTLPPNMVGVEWEIELEGSANVYEVHLASSLRELLEHERYGDEGA